MQTIVIDGEPHEFTDEAAPHIRKLMSDIADKTVENLQLSVRATALKDPNSAESKALAAELRAKDEEHAAIIRQMDEKIAEQTRLRDELIAQRAAAERQIIETSDAIMEAKRICPAVNTKGKSAAEIHRAVVKHITGRDHADKSDDFVAAVFEMHAANVPKEEPRRAPQRDALSDAIASALPQPGQAPPGSSRGAYEEMCREMTDAWKGKH